MFVIRVLLLLKGLGRGGAHVCRRVQNAPRLLGAFLGGYGADGMMT